MVMGMLRSHAMPKGESTPSMPTIWHSDTAYLRELARCDGIVRQVVHIAVHWAAFGWVGGRGGTNRPRGKSFRTPTSNQCTHLLVSPNPTCTESTVGQSTAGLGATIRAPIPGQLGAVTAVTTPISAHIQRQATSYRTLTPWHTPCNTSPHYDSQTIHLQNTRWT
jgi:hypothetical protein